MPSNDDGRTSALWDDALTATPPAVWLMSGEILSPPGPAGSSFAHKTAAGALVLVAALVALVAYQLLQPDSAALSACISSGGSGLTCPHDFQRGGAAFCAGRTSSCLDGAGGSDVGDVA